MFKVRYNRVVDENLSQKDENATVEENFRTISELHNLDLALQVAMGWARANPDKTVTDLEDFFRKEKIDIHLIASNKYDHDEYDLRSLFDLGKPAETLLVFSCRRDEDALKELKEHAESYEENYARLNSTGVMVPKGYQHTQPHPKKFAEMSIVELISHNYVRITKLLKTEEEMQDEYDKFLYGFYDHICKTYEDKPEIMLYGMAEDGSPVFSYSYRGGEEDIVCEIGIMMGIDSTGTKRTKLVPLNDRSTWDGFMDIKVDIEYDE